MSGETSAAFTANSINAHLPKSKPSTRPPSYALPHSTQTDKNTLYQTLDDELYSEICWYFRCDLGSECSVLPLGRERFA